VSTCAMHERELVCVIHHGNLKQDIVNMLPKAEFNHTGVDTFFRRWPIKCMLQVDTACDCWVKN